MTININPADCSPEDYSPGVESFDQFSLVLVLKVNLNNLKRNTF